MRKPYLLLCFLLSLLLVVAQQGAIAHEISHYSDNLAPSSEQRNKQSPDSQFCEKCFSFAQIGGAVNADPPPLVTPLLTYHYVAASPVVFLAADAPTSRSRDPPQSL